MSRVVGVVALSLPLFLFLFESCGRPTKSIVIEEQDSLCCQIVNIYVENSGSMKGYFSGNSQIKDIIKDYYDRINDSQSEGDTITLNYINTQIENSSEEIKGYLMDCQNKCTAAYTKIDEILSMAMKDINDSTVNIVISDYCFVSNNSSFPMAMSGITGLFSKRLKTNSNLSVAIIKYMSDFNGRFFPGGITIKKPMPFYLWIFGNEKQVKKIVNAPIKTPNCGILILQPFQTLLPNVFAKKKRMIDNNAILVSEWDKDRQRSGGFFTSCSPEKGFSKYSVKFELDMSKVILPEEELCDTNHYCITKGYKIESITRGDNNKYCFNISTSKPAPGVITITYMLQELPEWIEKSNYEGTGIPTDSTTIGVKYLIGGVYDAYHNLSNKLFETKITLK